MFFFLVVLSVLFNVCIVEQTPFFALMVLTELHLVQLNCPLESFKGRNIIIIVSEVIDEDALRNVLQFCNHRRIIELLFIGIKLSTIENMRSNVSKVISTKLIIQNLVKWRSFTPLFLRVKFHLLDHIWKACFNSHILSEVIVASLIFRHMLRGQRMKEVWYKFLNLKLCYIWMVQLQVFQPFWEEEF